MNFRSALKADAASVNFVHELWQLGDIGSDAPRLIARGYGIKRESRHL
jgi:hypothetical protein